MSTASVLLAAFALMAGGKQPATQETNGSPLLIGGLTVSADFIVFSHAGDLWRVPREGGEAVRLTEGTFEDDYPAFAPNGLSVAFSRRGADDWNVYTVGAQGGAPRQLTFNPAMDIVRGWDPSGTSVLFMSQRDEEAVFRLYMIATDAALPTALPLPRAWEGSFAPDGQRIAYVPWLPVTDHSAANWQRYRGGQASPIWMAELESGRLERLPRDDSNDRYPMWIGERVYFVSDRDGTFNLYVYDQAALAAEQLTSYENYGIETAAAGGGIIAFVQDGHIRLFDPASGEVRTVDVTLQADRSELVPRMAGGLRWIESASASAAGDRVILGMRGDVLSFDPDSGSFENLTGTPGAAERYPAVSPDGRWVAYFSDEEGEYELHIRSLDGEPQVKRVKVELRPTFYRELTWSPDSKLLAFSDKRLTLWVADIETGGARRVTSSEYSHQDSYQPAWSPDGRTLAYSRYESNRLRAIYVYDVATSRKVNVTGDRVHAEHPVFDRGGKYLFFVTSAIAPLADLGWSVLSEELLRPLVSRRLQVVVLRDGMPAPVFPITGAVNPAVDSAAPRPTPTRRGGPPANRPPPGARPGTPPQGGPPTPVSIAGLEGRMVPLPVPGRDFVDAAAGEPGIIYLLVNTWGTSQGLSDAPPRTLYRYDLSRPDTLVKLIEDVRDFAVTADGKMILYRRGDAWAMVPGDEPAGPDVGRLNLESLSVNVDPVAEWRQIYAEVWRLIRDYLYDDNYHGQNLMALEQHYAAYLPSITRRRDLNELLDRALGHLSMSQLSVGGGDTPDPAGSPSRIGLLGADFTIAEGLYRIARIYRSGDLSFADPLLSAPLEQPGIYISEGDYLLAVDDVRVDSSRNLYSYFVGKARTPTRITVASSPEGQASRTYTVVPLPGESPLRRIAWAERNRGIVEDESQGILGYIYVPDFGARGLESVMRQLLANIDKRGLIIDQRFAGGGITADFLIEWLGKKALFYYSFRQGDHLGVPTNALPENKVLLINDTNTSAAETFAFMFKQANLGSVLGTRTAGAGIGPYLNIPRLIDGGWVSIPNRAPFDPAGAWIIENQGVGPDIEIEFAPAQWQQSLDPQLQAAINTVLQAIVDNPPLEVVRPEYPTYK
ncbi:MAG: PD40 domain-containing protein [Gemmatimonadota bacterium]|nr:MAG: PD40 domain-containing protein [Gemmatimonadota bacterium]